MSKVSTKLFNDSYLSFVFAIVLFVMGFVSFSQARGDSIYNNAGLVTTDVFIGISLILIGCICLLGFVLLRIKAMELV